MLKRIFLLTLSSMFILMCLSSVLAQGDPSNTFAATVVDSQNKKTLIYDISYGKGMEKFQEFVGYRGASSVTIPFNKVKSVEVMGKTPGTSDLYSSDPYVDTVFHLIDGHTISIQLPAGWVWSGTTAFGKMSIETENLKVITFYHEGMAHKCPACGTVFHLEGFKYCPYDGAELEEFTETP